MAMNSGTKGLTRAWWAIGLILMFSIATADAADPNDANGPMAKRFTVSKETTFIKGPRNKDGTINYVAWLRKHYSKGVTQKNNAAVLVVKALGPRMLPSKHLDFYRKQLGLKLSHDAEYMESLYDYGKFAEMEFGEVDDCLEQVTQGPWTAKKYPNVAKWLKKNAKPLALARQASKRDRWYLPFIVEGDPPQLSSLGLPAITRTRTLGRALVAEAMRKLANGDSAGASADLLAAHRLGRLAGRGPTVIARMVGLLVDERATKGSVALMQSSAIKPGVLRKHLAGLNKLPEQPGMAEAIDKCDRFVALDAVQMVTREGLVFGKTLNVILGQGVDKAAGQGRKIPWWMIDSDVMLKRVNDEYDWAMKLAHAKSGEELKRLDREYTRHLAQLLPLSEEQIWKQKLRLVFGTRKMRAKRFGEMISDILVSLLGPSIARQVKFQRVREARFDLARVALGMRLYQADNGKLPAKLSALTPKYFKKIPGDWFSGGDLVYKRSKDGKGFVVYSVGLNGSHEGGVGVHGFTPLFEDDDADDIAVWYRYGQEDESGDDGE